GVALGDAAVLAGAADGGRVEAGLADDALHRRRQRQVPGGRGGSLGSGRGGRGGLGGGGGAGGDATDHLAGRDRGALGGEDLGQHPVGGGGDLDGDLVGLDLDQHLVLLHRLA